MKLHHAVLVAIAMPLLAGCDNAAADTMGSGQGRIALRLTDAPLPLDEVESINVFVVRVEARAAATTETEAQDDAASSGWVVLASPNAMFDLMELRNGVSVFLGDAAVPAGQYRSIRLILDTDQSGVTLKNGMILTGSSTPSILFPSAGNTGIKVLFDTPIDVDVGATTDVLLDFDAEQSFVVRGATILQNGLLFTPVIRATVN